MHDLLRIRNIPLPFFTNLPFPSTQELPNIEERETRHFYFDYNLLVRSVAKQIFSKIK